MSPQEIDTLRKEVKKTMIDLELDAWGKTPSLAKELSDRTGKMISRNTLSMALSGYRSSEPYQIILKELQSMLAERQSPARDNIHEGESQNN
jgi:hypothetical protein